VDPSKSFDAKLAKPATLAVESCGGGSSSIHYEEVGKELVR